MYVPIAKPATKRTRATPLEFVFHPIDKEVCNLTIFMAKQLIVMGANQFETWNMATDTSDGMIVDANGHSIASLAADSGSLKLLKIFFDDAAKKNRGFDAHQITDAASLTRTTTCYGKSHGRKSLF